MKPNLKHILSMSAVLCLSAGLVLSPSAGCADKNVKSAVITEVKTDWPDYPERPQGKWDTRKLRELTLSEAPAESIPIMSKLLSDDQITIQGDATASRQQMVQLIKQGNPKPKLSCTVEALVNIYYEEGGREHIRPDIALCQAIKETGYFNYGGDVLPAQNNFCGLGATGNHVRGAVFATPRLGARAHIQHLLAYASKDLPSAPIEDPRYQHIVKNRPEIHGSIQHWTGLNGVWAVPGTTYGQDILKLWQQALSPDGSDSSLAFAEKQLRQDPGNPANHIYRGIVYFKQGTFWLARLDFERAIELDPDSAEALFDLAITQEKLGKNKEAMKTYDRLLKADPGFYRGYYNRGMLRMQLQDYKAAIKDFEKNLELVPQAANACNEIGVAHMRMKKYDAAWQDFYRASRINDTNEHVLKNLASVYGCIKQ